MAEKMSLKEWAERQRKLSAVKGNVRRWSGSSIPYLRTTLNELAKGDVKEIVIMKGCTPGFTCTPELKLAPGIQKQTIENAVQTGYTRLRTIALFRCMGATEEEGEE